MEFIVAFVKTHKKKNMGSYLSICKRKPMKENESHVIKRPTKKVEHDKEAPVVNVAENTNDVNQSVQQQGIRENCCAAQVIAEKADLIQCE